MLSFPADVCHDATDSSLDYNINLKTWNLEVQNVSVNPLQTGSTVDIL